MKLFQWFTLAFLLSFNTLTNSIFAEGDGSDTEQGDSSGDASEPEEEVEEQGDGASGDAEEEESAE